MILYEEYGPVKIEEGCKIYDDVILAGPLHVGKNVIIYPGSVIGLEADHLFRNTDWNRQVTIGEGTVLKEHTVIHRGVERDTVIGNDCYIMHGSYIAHDCILQDKVKMAPFAALAGHCIVLEGAYLGMHSSVHQYTTIGAYAMLGMGAVVIKNVLPGKKVVGVPAREIGDNSVGLSRDNITQEQLQQYIETFKAVVWAKEL